MSAERQSSTGLWVHMAFWEPSPSWPRLCWRREDGMASFLVWGVHGHLVEMRCSPVKSKCPGILDTWLEDLLCSSIFRLRHYNHSNMASCRGWGFALVRVCLKWKRTLHIGVFTYGLRRKLLQVSLDVDPAEHPTLVSSSLLPFPHAPHTPHGSPTSCASPSLPLLTPFPSLNGLSDHDPLPHPSSPSLMSGSDNLLFQKAFPHVPAANLCLPSVPCYSCFCMSHAILCTR